MINGLMHSMTVCPDTDNDYAYIVSGQGMYLYDHTGKKYIDGCSGKAAAASVGHGVNEIVRALSQQASKCAIIPSQSFSSEVVESYLHKLLNFCPPGFSRAWVTTGGTEAIENAAKLAVQYHYLRGEGGRHKVISRMGSYHGNSFFALDISGVEYRKEIYKKAMFRHPHIPAAYTYRMPVDISIEEYSFRCANALEEKILEEGVNSVAAFVFEPVVAAALGAVSPPDGNYLTYLREICNKYGVLMIADEVFTGFGRTGKNFAVQHWNVQPDILAMGKGISGGYFPTGAIAVSEKVCEPFLSKNKYFMSASTFACNPLAAAVGSAVIDYIDSNRLVTNASDKGTILLQRLLEMYKHDIVGDIRGKGLMIAIEFVQNRITKEPFSTDIRIAKRINEVAREKGAIFYPGNGTVDGFAGDHLMIMPPLIIGDAEIDAIVAMLDESITIVTKQLGV
jgi:adenosylmethionine-8-amino-7-oxononanoate aminotransferase